MGSGREAEWVLFYGGFALVILVGLIIYELIVARRYNLRTPMPIMKQSDMGVDTQKELQQKVEAATRELKAANLELQRLDETKDEFVSMASHQLRTPLTSVKGYLSMVLEGDAGKLNDDQRKLLMEAFTSSERMVRLIGDFLNVSRLQNGRFVIDRSEQVDLAKIVENEIANVQEIAEGKGIGIAYHQPSHFPALFLDEDKLRQVIMNYLDNAIFYSPESKTVSVRLYTSDGQAILEVVDHGIGVPKAAQGKLFTKFFRADNARKQRPDGTGIGLYLAKKVVDGHDGKVIFSSKEGEGSTFGFRLPIKKLSAPPKPDATSL